MIDVDPGTKQRWTRRPLFAPTQMLTAEQLNLMMDEQRARIEKLMRGLHGNGVVFGLAVTRPQGSAALAISCGMALDRHGRLLSWDGGDVKLADIAAPPECAGRFTLSIHYARREDPGGGCGPCSDRPQWIDEGVAFSLRHEGGPIDRGCAHPPEGDCIGLDDYVCLRNASRSGALPPAADLEWACAEAAGRRRIGCKDIFYDPNAGIPIARVEIRNFCDTPGCTPCWGFGEVDSTCDVRPWVYRTPLLYELIKGCQNDLARVRSVQWGEGRPAVDGWPAELPWEDLAAALREGPEITFTKPVRVDSVTPGSAFLTAILWERQADYLLTRRIPAEPVALDPDDGLAARFRLSVDDGWIRNEIDSRSELKSGGRIELTLRGQMIRDRCGNMLDSVPLGYAPSTPPHSRPGGDFLALIRFAEEHRAPPPPPQPQPQPAPPAQPVQE
jgi:hypothetical protein